MKNKTIVITAFFAFLLFGFALSESLLIPKFKPFGTSTTFTDSTNFVVLNKSFKTTDSLMVDKVATIKGNLYLDTNGNGRLYYTGYDFYIDNQKNGGSNYYYVTGVSAEHSWYYSNSGSFQLAQLDTAGFNVKIGDLVVSSATRQLKVPGDSATDYDANDNITLNKQSGRIKTKALTTASTAFYDFTLTNSLITANSIILALPTFGVGTNTTLPVIIAHSIPAAGSATLSLYNGSAAALNGTVEIRFLIINNP